MRVVFDDDSDVICTDDHLFMLRNGNYKKVSDIGENDSLRRFTRNLNVRGYWEVRKSKMRNEHRSVYDFYNPQVNYNGKNIHHLDKTQNK